MISKRRYSLWMISIVFIFACGFVLFALPVMAKVADCDGAAGLHRALLEHDKARIEFKYKMQTGYIRRSGRGDIAIAQLRNEFLYAGPRSTLKAVQRHLKSLDRRGGAYALVFDPRGTNECVWLIGHSKFIVARRDLGSYQGQDRKSVAGHFRKLLNVDVRTKSRLPKLRNQPHSNQIANNQQSGITSMYRPPVDLRRAVIPDAIMSKIKKSAKTLLILPIGDLSAVPFAALPGVQDDEALVDYVSPIVLPSVDGLFFWVKMAKFYSNAVIIGDPDLSEDPDYEFIPLPGAKLEAQEVARLISSTALTGDQATHEAVMKKLRNRPNLIYLATHGIADAENPMDGSFLALRGKNLHAAEIKKLSYYSDHPLVVMSACQSGLGKTFNAGIFGLARAWIHAGAAQVLASQWNVDDIATAHLMTGYMTYMKNGMSSQKAFRQAMLKTRSKYQDAALWGSFNLFGYPQPER